jgi:hypothetical protein
MEQAGKAPIYPSPCNLCQDIVIHIANMRDTGGILIHEALKATELPEPLPSLTTSSARRRALENRCLAVRAKTVGGPLNQGMLTRCWVRLIAGNPWWIDTLDSTG